MFNISVQKFFLVVLGSVLLITAVSCQTNINAGNESRLSGRILLWHGWEDEEAAVLEGLVNTFEQLQPDVNIVTAAIPPDELLTQYEDTAALGLGPDLMLGSSEWMTALVEEGLIRPVNTQNLDTARYYPAAINTVTYAGSVYGLPLSIWPPGLYYNRQLVSTAPAATFDALLTAGAAGQTVLINSSAKPAFMGLEAFGGPLFSTDNRLTADQSGFINWLQWLQTAQDSPGVIVSQDSQSLERLFMEGRAAYYIANARQFNEFKAALEAESEETVVMVAPLPAGPFEQQPRPVLETDAFMFNSASSDHQYRLALALADFLTNTQQNNTLLRELGRIPANQRTRINAGVYPNAAAFAAQVRTAVSLPKPLYPVLFGPAGDAVYTAVLSGAAEPETAVCELIQNLRQEMEGAQPNFESCQPEEN